MFGDRRHRRDQQQRSLAGVCAALRSAASGLPPIDVIDAEHVGQKQPVEPAALQRLGQIDPVRQPVIVGGAVARMGPQSRRLMRDAVHGEGVEPDLFFHVLGRLSARPIIPENIGEDKAHNLPVFRARQSRRRIAATCTT